MTPVYIPVRDASQARLLQGRLRLDDGDNDASADATLERWQTGESM